MTRKLPKYLPQEITAERSGDSVLLNCKHRGMSIADVWLANAEDTEDVTPKAIRARKRERDALAALFAASPDMLAVCTYALDVADRFKEKHYRLMTEYFSPDEQQEIHKLYNLLDIAIKKARRFS